MRILYDAEELKIFMEYFFDISKICASIYDCNMNLLAGTKDNTSAFCLKMHDWEMFFGQCIASNERAFQKVLETRETYIYTCHAGLYEVVSPIIANDVIVGFLMIGQFLPANEEERWWGNLKKRDGDDEYLTELKATFTYLKIIPENEMRAWVEIVKACASYIAVKQYVRLWSDEKFNRIDRYVHENLAEKLTADSLSSALGFPKSAMYSIIRQNVNQSLGDYIRATRIERAKELLAHTDSSIAEIAGVIGMDDYNYFTRVFKKTVCETPREYRRKFLST